MEILTTVIWCLYIAYMYCYQYHTLQIYIIKIIKEYIANERKKHAVLGLEKVITCLFETLTSWSWNLYRNTENPEYIK